MFKMTTMAMVFLVLAGCAAKHGPVLYPNDHLKKAGEVQAQRDIDECSRLADNYVKQNPGAKVAGSTVTGGAVGAATGTAVGAVTGGVGRGAAVGAVAGATTGLFRGIIKGSQPSPVYKNFVNRCLKDKGYDPIGWE